MVRGWNLGLRLYFLIFLALSSATGVDTASGFSKNGVLGIPYVGNMDISESWSLWGKTFPGLCRSRFWWGWGCVRGFSPQREGCWDHIHRCPTIRAPGPHIAVTPSLRSPRTTICEKTWVGIGLWPLPSILSGASQDKENPVLAST